MSENIRKLAREAWQCELVKALYLFLRYARVQKSAEGSTEGIGRVPTSIEPLGRTVNSEHLRTVKASVETSVETLVVGVALSCRPLQRFDSGRSSAPPQCTVPRPYCVEHSAYDKKRKKGMKRNLKFKRQLCSTLWHLKLCTCGPCPHVVVCEAQQVLDGASSEFGFKIIFAVGHRP